MNFVFIFYCILEILKYSYYGMKVSQGDQNVLVDQYDF